MKRMSDPGGIRDMRGLGRLVFGVLLLGVSVNPHRALAVGDATLTCAVSEANAALNNAYNAAFVAKIQLILTGTCDIFSLMAAQNELEQADTALAPFAGNPFVDFARAEIQVALNDLDKLIDCCQPPLFGDGGPCDPQPDDFDDLIHFIDNARAAVLQIGGIPAVSQWGMAAMALAMFCVGTIAFRRRQVAIV